MAEVATRPWFLLGGVLVLAAALAGLAAAFSAPLVAPTAHLLLAEAALFALAGGLAYGFVSPFLKREAPGAWPATFALVLVGAGALVALVAPRWGALLLGAAFVILPLHVVATAALGKPWRGGFALFAKDQPFRVGDTLAAASFAVALVGLAASGALHVAYLRGLVVAPLAAHLLLFALPFFGGVLVFLLPRNAKRPLPGATLVGAALLLLALSGAALVAGFAALLPSGYRFPAAGVLVALVLAGGALVQLRFPERPGPQVVRARPLLRAAAALGALSGLAVMLAFPGDAPGPLVPVAAYALLVLALVLAASSTLLGAPILLNAVPRDGRWAAVAAAVAIAGVFLLAPRFTHDRTAVGGALAFALAAALVAWGMAPLRTPRRDCPP